MVVFGLRNAQLCVGLLAVLLLLPFHGLATAQAERDTGPLRAIDSALRERNFEQALELIRVQLQQAPADARLWTLEGIAFAGSGKDKEALLPTTRR